MFLRKIALLLKFSSLNNNSIKNLCRDTFQYRYFSCITQVYCDQSEILLLFLASDAIDVQLVGGVLTRNSWTDIGAAIDVTGSMAKCYARLDQWLGLSQSNKLIRYFDFFNDGDRTPDANKVIGSTGMN